MVVIVCVWKHIFRTLRFSNSSNIRLCSISTTCMVKKQKSNLKGSNPSRCSSCRNSKKKSISAGSSSCSKFHETSENSFQSNKVSEQQQEVKNSTSSQSKMFMTHTTKKQHLFAGQNCCCTEQKLQQATATFVTVCCSI